MALRLITTKGHPPSTANLSPFKGGGTAGPAEGEDSGACGQGVFSSWRSRITRTRLVPCRRKSEIKYLNSRYKRRYEKCVLAGKDAIPVNYNYIYVIILITNYKYV
jgi:hypothetical protein